MNKRITRKKEKNTPRSFSLAFIQEKMQEKERTKTNLHFLRISLLTSEKMLSDLIHSNNTIEKEIERMEKRSLFPSKRRKKEKLEILRKKYEETKANITNIKYKIKETKTEIQKVEEKMEKMKDIEKEYNSAILSKRQAILRSNTEEAERLRVLERKRAEVVREENEQKETLDIAQRAFSLVRDIQHWLSAAEAMGKVYQTNKHGGFDKMEHDYLSDAGHGAEKLKQDLEKLQKRIDGSEIKTSLIRAMDREGAHIEDAMPECFSFDFLSPSKIHGISIMTERTEDSLRVIVVFLKNVYRDLMSERERCEEMIKEIIHEFDC